MTHPELGPDPQPDRFPPYPQSVLAETEAMTITPDMMRDRRQETAFTVDKHTSPDLDDAFRIEKVEDDDKWKYKLHVTIADVDAFVKKDSETDEEAKKRGFSRYFPEGISHMIPPKLSEDLASLLPDQERPTITITIPLDDQLNAGDPKFEKTAFKSKGRYDFAEIDNKINNQNDPLNADLSEWATIAQVLQQKRKDAGALPYIDIERGIAVDEEGTVRQLTSDERHQSYLMVQEFMILTNTTVAKYLSDRNIPALFRNHSARDLSSPDETPIHSLQEYLDAADVEDLDAFREGISLKMNRATYDSEAKGHFGLNLSAYLQFTSPIRRFADLVNHRILAAYIEDPDNFVSPYTEAELNEISNLLNTIWASRIGERREGAKAAANEAAAAFLAGGNITDATQIQMDRIIKLAARENEGLELTDEIAAEIESRIDTNDKEKQLRTEDLYCILTEPINRTDAWEHLQIRVLRWLQKNTGRVNNIIDKGANLGRWTRPDSKATLTDKTFKGMRIYAATSKIFIPRGDGSDEMIEITSDTTRHVRENHAINLAHIDLLARIFQVDLTKEPEEPLPVDYGVKAPRRPEKDRRDRAQRPARRLDET